MQEIYLYEVKNIIKATLKYLLAKPDKKLAPFSYEWLLTLRKNMFGEVWNWVGKIRQVELSIGVKAYLVSTEIKKLVDDLELWEENKSLDVIEIALRIDHRATNPLFLNAK